MVVKLLIKSTRVFTEESKPQNIKFATKVLYSNEKKVFKVFFGAKRFLFRKVK